MTMGLGQVLLHYTRPGPLEIYIVISSEPVTVGTHSRVRIKYELLV